MSQMKQLEIAMNENDLYTVSVIQKSILFCNTNEDSIREMIDKNEIEIHSFNEGETIRKKEESKNALSVLISGTLIVEKELKNKIIRMSTLRAGDIFGAASVFTEESSYVAKITAKEKGSYAEISEESMSSIFQKESSVLYQYLRYLNNRIRFLSNRIDMLAYESSDDRLFAYLESCKEEGECMISFNMKTLASTTGMSRATLYRSFEALEKSGKIKKQGKTIHIL